jgi:hypothetical protein
MIGSNIKLFRDECEALKVKYEIDVRRRLTLNELVKYSEFFDLILIDAKAMCMLHNSHL